MSTKSTTSSNQSYGSNTGFAFNGFGQNAYDSMTPQMAGTVLDYMKDPQSSTFFNQRLQQAFGNIGLQSAAQQKQLFSNLNASGMSGQGMSGFLGDQLARQSRATSAQKANAFTGNLLDAENARRWATGLAASYQPQQIGVSTTGNSSGTTTQSTGGLGTWLPQVIGAGVGAFTGGMGGGGLGSLFSKGGGSGSTPIGTNALGGYGSSGGFAGTGMNAGQFFNPGMGGLNGQQFAPPSFNPFGY